MQPALGKGFSTEILAAGKLPEVPEIRIYWYIYIYTGSPYTVFSVILWVPCQRDLDRVVIVHNSFWTLFAFSMLTGLMWALAATNFKIKQSPTKASLWHLKFKVSYEFVYMNLFIWICLYEFVSRCYIRRAELADRSRIFFYGSHD